MILGILGEIGYYKSKDTAVSFKVALANTHALNMKACCMLSTRCVGFNYLTQGLYITPR